MNKSNRPVYKGNTFDSGYELTVYKAIERVTAIISTLEIRTQVSVLCRPASRNYKQKNWKVDFFVEDKLSGKHLLIEAKGQPKSHGKMIDNIKSLDIYSPSAHDNLLIVVPNDYQRRKYRAKQISIKDSLANSINVPVIFYRDLRDYIVNYFR